MAADSRFMGDFDDSDDDFDDENEIDEDMEAILYSQIHFKSTDLADTAFGNNSFLTTQRSASDHVPYSISVISVQALQSDSHTSMDVGSADKKGRSWSNPVKTTPVVPVTRPTLGVSSPTSLSKKSAAACSDKAERNKVDAPYKKHSCSNASQKKTEINSQENNAESSGAPVSEINSQENNAESSGAPAVSVTLFSEQSKSKVSRSKRAGSDIAETYVPSTAKNVKTKSSSQQKFDMELELGIKTKPQVDSKLHPFISGPDTLSVPGNTMSLIPTRNLKHVSSCPEFISISSSDSQRPSGYRSGLLESAPAPVSLKQLSEIVSHSRKQSGKKEIVTISSDSEGDDTSSSDSDSNGRPSSGPSDKKDLVQASYDHDSSTSDSDSVCSTSTDSSESDVEFKDEVKGSGRSLDLNWNVDATDRQTIKKYQEESSNKEGSKWHSIDMDQFRGQASRPASRYYTKMDMRCHNCDKRGHLSKVCPEPKKQPVCGLCGEPGHTLRRCPGRLCYNCNCPGHTGAGCPSPRRNHNIECRRCWMLGHMAYECPDLWRQYHMTTVPSSDSEAFKSGGLVMKETIKNSRVYCCNCARRGHFAFECTKQRMDRHSQPSYPFISEYDGATSYNSTGGKERKDWSAKGHQRWHSADSRSKGDRSQWSWSNSKRASGSVDTSGKPDANWNLHRTRSFPELDRFRQSPSPVPDPVKKARKVSTYVHGFLGRNISGDTPGRNSSQSKLAGASHGVTLKKSEGEDEFKTPTVPSKNKRKKDSQWYGGAFPRNEGQEKDRSYEDSSQKVKLQKNKNKRGYPDFCTDQDDSPKYKKNKRKKNCKPKNPKSQNLSDAKASPMPVHRMRESVQQKGSPAQSQGSRRVSEQVVQSSAGFKTSIRNLVISRTFQNSQN